MNVLQAVLTAFQVVFGWLTSFEIFGIPFLYILLGTAVFGLILNFVKGERK